MLWGWLLLAALTAFAVVSSLGVALRSEPGGRTELAIVAMLVFFALLGTPALALGYTNLLTPARLAGLAVVLSGGVFLAVLRGRKPRELLLECARAAAGIARLPLDGLRAAARARSGALVGVVAVGALYVFGLVCAVLLPLVSWDGYLYHEPIIGFSIQNHGFAPIDMQPWLVTNQANGFPRLCEMIALWFVIFTDKTLVELPNVIGGIGMFLALFALLRRYTDKVTALGWASVLSLSPAGWDQIPSVYIDLQLGFFLIAALYFATRPDYRVRDALIATLALGLVVASKASGLSWAPLMAFFAYARLFAAYRRSRLPATIATAVGGGVGLAAVASIQLVHNWRFFDNPLWPLTFSSRQLGISFHGLQKLEEASPRPTTQALIDTVYGLPTGGIDDIIARPFGYAIPWIVVPVGAIAIALALVVVAVELSGLKSRSAASNLGWVLVPMILGLWASPNVSVARFNFHLVAALMAAGAWLLSRKAWARAREGLVTAAIVLSIIPFFWRKHWFWANEADVVSGLSHPFGPHAYFEKPKFDFLGQARFEELGPGDRVAFTQDVAFLGALFNFQYSNHVQYVPYTSAQDYLARIREYDPKWVALGPNSDARKALDSTGQWEPVGQITSGHDTIIVRRRGSLAGAH